MSLTRSGNTGRRRGDENFLLDAGAEILFETARFWSSRALPEADGRCHIRGVIGPDEYHEHIDDNAYTNVMARWNIRRALDVVALLRTRWPARWASLASHLQLEDGELTAWRQVADTMATGLDPATGLFEQFAGYFALEDIDLANYAGRTVPMDVVLGRERTQKSQVVKQADVVALLGLLPEEFVGDTKLRELPLLRTALQPWQFLEPRHAWAGCRQTRRHRNGAAVLSARRRRSISLIPMRPRTAAFTSRLSAGSGCWRYLASRACHSVTMI